MYCGTTEELSLWVWAESVFKAPYGILTSAMEFADCCEILPWKEITVWFYDAGELMGQSLRQERALFRP